MIDAAEHLRLGVAAWRAGHAGAAERHLREALRLAPDHWPVRDALCRWELEAGRVEQALPHARRAVELAPGPLEAPVSRWLALEIDGAAPAHNQLVEQMIAHGTSPAPIAIIYARISPQLGREGRALELIHRLLAWPALATADRSSLHYAAAGLLDRMGRYEQALEHARLANSIGVNSWNAQQHSRSIDRQIEFFTRDRLGRLQRSAQTSRRPVFIVGMPRSGTSLIEQILASHPQVYGAGELPSIMRIVRLTAAQPWAQGVAYPEYLDALPAGEADRLANLYLSAIAELNQTARQVTDKMPLNFLHLGLIAILFPGSRVIHCTRNALDTCLSCYVTQFAHGHEFGRDLEHLAHFYRDYQRLMAHWNAVLDLPILDVKYEEVVGDLERQTRRMLDFLELPFDERCLRFHENPRPVATASRRQVTTPLYGSSVGRWKNYQRFLAPLTDLLGPPVMQLDSARDSRNVSA